MHDILNTYTLRSDGRKPSEPLGMDLARADCKDIGIAAIGGSIGALAAGLSIFSAAIIAVICAVIMLVVKVFAKPYFQ